MDINLWLKKFKVCWQSQDIKGVLSLFHKNVVYFETPFKKLKNLDEISQMWEEIKKQRDIHLDFEIFSSCENKHSVIWKLKYHDENDVEKTCSGTYLIQLDEVGLCTYFHHACELKE